MSSNTLTRGVRVVAQPRYVPEQSDPSAKRYFFAYHITIRNEGEATVQLISRHWVITNGEGKVEEVRGPGVVGHQPPRLHPPAAIARLQDWESPQRNPHLVACG